MTTTQATRDSANGLSFQRCPVTRQLMPNRVRSFDGFHVSYNNSSSDYGCPTTALVLGGRVFLILNGDHAGDLIEAAELGGLPGCMDLFIERIASANSRSEHMAAFGLADDPFGLHATMHSLFGQGCMGRLATAISDQMVCHSQPREATDAN